MTKRAHLAIVAIVAACGGAPVAPPAHPAPPSAPPAETQLERVTPSAAAIDARPLVALAQWIRDEPVPIYSLLISKDGKLVFELYTGSIDPEAAHYLMSVTKSIVSMLVGIAIERGLVPAPDTPLADAFYPAEFPTTGDRERFRAVTIKDVMAMSALDTPDPPRVNTPAAIARQHAFLGAQDRLRFALAQPILEHPGETFLYNDIGPMLATGLLARRTGMRPLRFAAENLFGPLGFRNYEWMHRDLSGLDNGGYGLRLRPVDLHALGVLYLNRGAWRGRQIVPAAWVDTSFTPWLRSGKRPYADYGWFWWQETFAGGWTGHEANGWKGQRILVFRERGVVVTMTGYFEHGNEAAVVKKIVESYVAPALDGGGAPSEAADAELARVLHEVRGGPLRGPPNPERRMIPTVAPKERARL